MRNEFSKNNTKNGRNFCFSAATFFVLKIEKSFFLAPIKTWYFRRFWAICRYSPISGYRDIRITPCIICRDDILGGSRLENGGNLPKTNFKQVLDHLPGFENYTFFDFQKKLFSLHPTAEVTIIEWNQSFGKLAGCLRKIELKIKRYHSISAGLDSSSSRTRLDWICDFYKYFWLGLESFLF